jgi:hypothetical protein
MQAAVVTENSRSPRRFARLAARVRERNWRSDRDALHVAEELCWDFPYGFSFEEFAAALDPLVDGLDVDRAGAVRARVWRVLPQEYRDVSWELLAESLAAAT